MAHCYIYAPHEGTRCDDFFLRQRTKNARHDFKSRVFVMFFEFVMFRDVLSSKAT